MKVFELIEALEQLPGDLDIRIAYQQSYPLTATLHNVAVEVVQFDCQDSAIVGVDDLEDDQEAACVWLAASDCPWNISPYAPRDVWNV